MRTSRVQMLVPLAMFAAACGGGTNKSAELSEDLKQDLAAASSPKLELASQAGDFKPMRFVSEIEQSTASAPAPRAPSPRPVRAPVKAAPAPEPEEIVAAPPAPEETQVAEAPQSETDETVSAVPTVAPRPAALPVDMPSTGVIGDGGYGAGRGNGRGGEIGGIIGVVIRGGGVGDDHCVPRRRTGRRPFPILPMR